MALVENLRFAWLLFDRLTGPGTSPNVPSGERGCCLREWSEGLASLRFLGCLDTPDPPGVNSLPEFCEILSKKY